MDKKSIVSPFLTEAEYVDRNVLKDGLFRLILIILL